jgi:glutamate mutase epsilon subunit
MGMEIAAGALAVVAVGAEVLKAGYEVKAAGEKEYALDLQSKEMKLYAQQKTLANYDAMEKVIDAQIAHQSTTGTAFSSPSFNAIQRETLNIGAKQQRNTQIENELHQQNIKTEKRNVKNTLYAQLFGDVAHTATTAFDIYSKIPFSGKK